MWFKHRAWIPVAWLLCLGNLISVWFAARPAEPWHATIHALLAVLFGLGAQRLAARPVDAAPTEMNTLREEVEQLRVELEAMHGRPAEMEEIQNRLDFAERMLMQLKERSALPTRKEP